MAREALACYRAMPTQEPFHRSFASERLGLGGKRAGKTVMVASHFSALVTDRPIYASDGQEIPIRRPKPNAVWRFWVIGFDQAHIGQTIHRVLFEPGFFKVIKDKCTGKWRTYNEALPEDRDRILESKPAEPLIPKRFYKDEHSWAWEERASGVFKSVKLEFTNRAGKPQVAMIYAFPSTQPQAKQGDPVDGIWIDEDIRFARHYQEWQDRLADREGQILWSAWPHCSNDAMVSVNDEAEKQAELGITDPTVFKVQLVMSENPYLTQKGKVEQLGRMASDDERRSRDRGEFIFDTVRVYDFKRGVHGIPSDDQLCPFEKIIEEAGCFPLNWTRYMALDPSHTRTGVVFAVIPPPEEYGHRILIEGELVIKRADCNECARRVHEFVQGRNYEAFIIDKKAGAQTLTGRDRGFTTKRIYAEAFEKYRVRSRQTGFSFTDGCADISARQMMVRDVMYDDGSKPSTTLRIWCDRCPQLMHELRDARKRVVGGEVTEKLAGRAHDLIDALEYLVASKPVYINPSEYPKRKNPILDYVKDVQADPGRRGDVVHFGPGAGVAA